MNKLRFTLLIGTAAVAACANCNASMAVYAVGDIAQCDGGVKKAAANKTSAMIPDNAMVVTLGDSVYPLATTKYFNSCYAPTWGRHLDHTLAVPGNHDYVSGRLTDFAKYFGTHSDPQGYFARHVGKWLFIGLDSNQRGERLTQQMTWLGQTLAKESKGATCIAAFWHHALFSSGLHSGDGEQMRTAWQLLYDAHADIVMSGHEHFYERFELFNAHGARDDQGIREFVVGTGGATLYGIYKPSMRSSVRRAEHGVLALDISDDGYRWEFRTVDNEVADRGEGLCHAKTRNVAVDQRPN
jgi:hypothetical protein